MKRFAVVFLVFVLSFSYAFADIYTLPWCDFYAPPEWLVVTEETKWMYDKEIQIAFNDTYADAVVFFEEPGLGYLEIRVDLQLVPDSEGFSFDDIDTNSLFQSLKSSYSGWSNVFDLDNSKMQTLGNNKWFVVPGAGEYKNTVEYQTCYNGKMLLVTAIYQYQTSIDLLTANTEFFLKYLDYSDHEHFNTDVITH